MKALSYIITVIGILLAIYAVVGRFIGEPTILGFIPGIKIKAVNGLIAANTVLLIAILTNLCGCGKK